MIFAANGDLDESSFVNNYVIAIFAVELGPAAIYLTIYIAPIACILALGFVHYLLVAAILLIPGSPGCVVYMVAFEIKAVKFERPRAVTRGITKRIFGLSDEALENFEEHEANTGAILPSICLLSLETAPMTCLTIWNQVAKNNWDTPSIVSLAFGCLSLMWDILDILTVIFKMEGQKKYAYLSGFIALFIGELVAVVIISLRIQSFPQQIEGCLSYKEDYTCQRCDTGLNFGLTTE